MILSVAFNEPRPLYYILMKGVSMHEAGYMNCRTRGRLLHGCCFMLSIIAPLYGYHLFSYATVNLSPWLP